MKVIVLGTGCPTCKKLYEDVKSVVEELSLNVELEKVEDIEKIMQYGIMSVPALVIDGEVKFYGRSPSKEELKMYLTNNK